MTANAGRALPEDLVQALRRVRKIEAIAHEAGGAQAHQRAVQATGAVILAAVNAGWRVTELAEVLELTRQAVSNRVQAARRLYGEHSPALVFDAPLGRPSRPRERLTGPAADREWFDRTEAAEFAGVHVYTIGNWLEAGLLPHTDRTGVPHLILRADLVRVMRAPRYNKHGVDYAATRAIVN